VLLTVLLSDRPDRIECVSDAAESFVSSADRWAILNGAAFMGGDDGEAPGTGVVGSDEVEADKPGRVGNSGTDVLGKIIVFRSRLPLFVPLRRGVACYNPIRHFRSTTLFSYLQL